MRKQQEIILESFFKIKLHLLTQNEKSTDEKKIYCRYRGVNNKTCPIGFLINDELYNPLMEGHSYLKLIHTYPELITNFWFLNHKFESIKNNKIEETLGCQLQYIHDITPVSKWNELLTKLEIHLIDYILLTNFKLIV